MNRATNVTIDAETYYAIRTLLISAKMAVSGNRPMYVWQPWEIQDLIDSLNNDALFIFEDDEDYENEANIIAEDTAMEAGLFGWDA